MKLSKTAIAVGAAVATLAGAANAAAPYASYDATLNLSSASAIRDTFLRMVKNYCDTSGGAIPAPAVYELGASSNYRAYECQFKPSTDPVYGNELLAKGLNGKKVLVKHTVQVNNALGGSVVGVQPILQAIPMQYVRVEAACAANGVDSFTGFARWNCANSDWLASEAGASDTEPASFKGVNLPSGLTPSTSNPSIYDTTTANAWSLPVDETGIDIKNMFSVGFGVAATDALIAAGVNSLSKAQVQALLSGNVEDWGQIVPSLAGSPVKICRRTAGSGTQASANAYFNQNPCQDGINASLTVATAADTGPIFGTLTVVENATTSNLKSCLVSANTAGEYAIGHVSLENNEVVAGWDFIAVNGVAPFDAAEAAVPADGVQDRIREDRFVDGTYDYVMEPTMQWRTAAAGPKSRTINGITYTVPVLANAPGNAKLSLAQLIRDNAGNPEVTKTLPGVISLPNWWQVAPYSANRGTATEKSQGVANFARDGKSCKPLTYIP